MKLLWPRLQGPPRRAGGRFAARRRAWGSGFTLLELVVVILLLATLGAIAVPIYIDTARSARSAVLVQLGGVLQTAANLARAKCLVSATCDVNASNSTVTINGRAINLNYGWLDGGDFLNNGQIDDWVNLGGFTPVLVSGSEIRFEQQSAPTQATCSVTYQDAYTRGPVLGIGIVIDRTGC